MGNYTMVIHGTGAHHNIKTGPIEGQRGDNYIYGRANDYDADLLFREFVEDLKAKGHNVTGATITVGGMYGVDGVLPRDYVNPLLAPKDAA